MTDAGHGLDPELLAILACPSCHAPLEPQAEPPTLRCTGQGCGLVYPVQDGIPVLLVDEASRGDH